MMQSSMKQMHMDYTMSQRASSARTAAAASACTQSASHNAIIAILDAIIMASIIIYGLIMILGLRAIAMIAIIIAILVLVVGLVIQKANVPWCCELAI